ncbi:MAG TPA: hypothetical protein VHL80_04590 [Polyangia bacterium]|nr:hypothetical protein [Polyangia bacterium]
MYAWGAALWAALLAAPAAAVAPAPGIAIATAAGGVEVRAGRATWALSTTAFDVVHAAALDGRPRLGPGRATVRALGKQLAFGPPSAVTHGADWVELRGWVDAPSHLWYVARYQFYADHPLARLVLTVTDRHDTSPAEEPSDAYWKGRELSALRLELGARGGSPATVTQHNSWSGAAAGAPWVDVVSASGAPYQWAVPDPALIHAGGQIAHAAGSDANQVVWHPMFEGRARLAALVAGFRGGAVYRAAKAVTYEVVDAQGQTHAITGDQRLARIELGAWPLSKSSVVRLEATGSGQETAIAGTLAVVPEDGRPPFDVPLVVRDDGVLASGPVTLAVKDFWQHHPISLVRTPDALGWQAIETPAEYTGGMGVTIESMIALDGPAKIATDALYAPPPRALPARVHPVDGSLARGPVGARFDALVREFVPRYAAELDRMDDFGWRNWGDYQIGNSYTDKKTGTPVEDWANLQYDLPTGLLVAWLRTGDERLWRWAQASVRHLMDLDLVKFHPFMDKLDGLVYRKGEMPRARSHVAAEPIVDQGFAWRSLLLYYALTGEEWARDLAKQNIDRLVYYATTRPGFVLEGGRPTAWMLRGALAGAEWFPGDREHDYQKTADEIVRQLVSYFGEHHRLPGRQPVWEGQIVEGLAEYHRRTGRADVAAVIVGEMRHLLHDGVRARPDGGFDVRYCYDDKGCGKVWTDEENYFFLWLSSLAYAGAISHDPRFGQWADALFAYGEKRLGKRRDVRGWTSVLGFPHLYVELAAAGRS